MKNEEAIKYINKVQCFTPFHNNGYPEHYKALEEGKLALKKTMPMKVEKRIVNEQEASGFAETCPSCHVFVYDNYCHRCGQNLDWSE